MEDQGRSRAKNVVHFFAGRFGRSITLRHPTLLTVEEWLFADDGKLRVFDLDTREEIQCIDAVGPYAHLELGDGYLVASQHRKPWNDVLRCYVATKT
jgi:hypothetical protein